MLILGQTPREGQRTLETSPQTTHTPTRRAQLTVEEYVAGVLACDPACLGRAITLIESRHAAHRDTAQEVSTASCPVPARRIACVSLARQGSAKVPLLKLWAVI